jgi:hypothetical protein
MNSEFEPNIGIGSSSVALSDAPTSIPKTIPVQKKASVILPRTDTKPGPEDAGRREERPFLDNDESGFGGENDDDEEEMPPTPPSKKVITLCTHPRSPHGKFIGLTGPLFS